MKPEALLAIASCRPGLYAQVYCVLQIGYFRAKHVFFRFDWNEVEDDCAFEHKPIAKHEHYTQRKRIADLFGYRPWTAEFLRCLPSRPRRQYGSM